MNELESSRHLFQPPSYCGKEGLWHRSYWDALSDCANDLTWDSSAILTILALNYACGDRTLLKQVKKRPWLSKVTATGGIELEDVPKHGRNWMKPAKVATRLGDLLYDEASQVCRDTDDVYLLLSGGLDSRIVAGVLARLYRDGKLKRKPIGVTWGLEQSRDVVYGRRVAEIVGFDWLHVPIQPEVVIHNINETAFNLGACVHPTDLHAMEWFKGVPSDALVLAGSYGDSVGRAEFSGSHILERNPLSPKNYRGLIRKDVLPVAYDSFQQDRAALYKRMSDSPRYALCEGELQGFYMRGMIAHAMSVINSYCHLYQMFTAPEVYSFMWSLHPSLRTNTIYACLLHELNKGLAQLPWARTNKALRGKTRGSQNGLLSYYHEYPRWISNELHDQLDNYIDFDFLDSMEIFDMDAFDSYRRAVKDAPTLLVREGPRPYNVWVWLAGLCQFGKRVAEQGKRVGFYEHRIIEDVIALPGEVAVRRGLLRRLLSKSDRLRRTAKKFRRTLKMLKAIIQLPPTRTR